VGSNNSIKTDNAGKGMSPKKGYDQKKYDENFDSIDWGKKWCPMCGKWGKHTSGSCPELFPQAIKKVFRLKHDI
jgi:hypothetical protein